MCVKATFSACKDCRDRFVGCHSTCEKYLAEKADHSKKVREVLRVKNVEDGMDSYKCRVVIETKKRFDKRR